MRALRHGSAIFVAGAVNREVNVAVTLGLACGRVLFGVQSVRRGPL